MMGSEPPQIGDQVSNLLVRDIRKGGHLAAALTNDVCHALVVGRCTAGEELLPIDVLQPRTIQGRFRIGAMTDTAGGVVEALSALLLCAERTLSRGLFPAAARYQKPQPKQGKQNSKRADGGLCAQMPIIEVP